MCKLFPIVDIAAKLERAFPPQTLALLQEMGRIAAASGLPLYLVGGSVRDLLLERAILDLDLVVPGDAGALAALLARRLNGEVVFRSQFGTARLKTPVATLDLAAARQETYPYPGALPQVRPGTLQEDLFRRDFTFNAMALDLTPSGFGQLLDPFGGRGDLESRLVRVLHPRSFQDDATRVLRAVRYEQRLGFRLEEGTEELLRRDTAFLNTISGHRIRRELERVLQEEWPERPLRRAQELGVLPAIYPPLRWGPELEQGLQRFREKQERLKPLLVLALLSAPLQKEEGEGFLRRLNMPGRWAKVVRDVVELKQELSGVEEGLPPSQVYERLRPYLPEAIEAWALLSPSSQQRQLLERFLSQWRTVRPLLRGEDLLALGVPRGPLIGRLLQELLRARLDGEVTTRAEEERLVRRYLDQTHGKED